MLQLYIPLNTKITYAQTRAFAKAIAELLAERKPKLIVARMPKVFRTRKVFIDWSQNDDYKTTVSVYSLRAKYHRPYVSVPLTWEELQQAVDQNDADELYFTPEQTLARVAEMGDLFKPVLSLKQTLPSEVASLIHKASARRLATNAERRSKRQRGRSRLSSSATTL